MFCQRCGASIQADFNVCPKCGTPIVHPGTPVYPNRFERHVRTLGILWIILGALWLVPSLFFMTVGHAVPFMMHRAFLDFGPVFLSPLMFSLGAGFLVIAAAGICIGWGLMQHEPWARIAAIILGILALVHPPFGTLLGILTLWVLLSNDAAAYDRIARTR
jgi:zinc-ribbon domain